MSTKEEKEAYCSLLHRLLPPDIYGAIVRFLDDDGAFLVLVSKSLIMDFIFLCSLFISFATLVSLPIRISTDFRSGLFCSIIRLQDLSQRF